MNSDSAVESTRIGVAGVKRTPPKRKGRLGAGQNTG